MVLAEAKPAPPRESEVKMTATDPQTAVLSALSNLDRAMLALLKTDGGDQAIAMVIEQLSQRASTLRKYRAKAEGAAAIKALLAEIGGAITTLQASTDRLLALPDIPAHKALPPVTRRMAALLAPLYLAICRSETEAMEARR